MPLAQIRTHAEPTELRVEDGIALVNDPKFLFDAVSHEVLGASLEEEVALLLNSAWSRVYQKFM